jgi:hypothetical protein
MRIAIQLSEEINTAISVWLTALGHQLVATADNPERLVLDHQHLQTLDTANCPVSSQNWLLIDSQLTTTQTIQALQQGCGYITTAPLDKNTLDNWLAGTNPLPNMLHLETDHPLPTPELDPRLDQFINIVTNGIWTTEQQQQAKQLIPWRDIALDLPQFQDLQQEGKLTPLQQAQLACHTLAGAELLTLHGQHKAAQIALQHHEHFDGTGFPKQLKGAAINPLARLAKLYDAYTGLRKEKAYAKALDHDTAMQKLQYGDGYLWPTQFDSDLLNSLIDNQQAVSQFY